MVTIYQDSELFGGSVWNGDRKALWNRDLKW